MAVHPPADPAARQRSDVLIEVGKHARLRVTTELTPAGLLSIAVLVSSILLSTAVLVTAGGAAARRLPRRLHE